MMYMGKKISKMNSLLGVRHVCSDSTPLSCIICASEWVSHIKSLGYAI